MLPNSFGHKPISTPSKKNAPPALPAGADPLTAAPSAIANAASTFVGFTPKAEPYDDKEAKKAAAAIRPRLAAIAPGRIVTPRLDIDAAARALLGVHAFVTQAPHVRDWFAHLAKAGLFDSSNIDQLRRVASVVIFFYREVQAAGAFKATARGVRPPPARVDPALENVLRGPGEWALLAALRSPRFAAIPLRVRGGPRRRRPKVIQEGAGSRPRRARSRGVAEGRLSYPRRPAVSYRRRRVGSERGKLVRVERLSADARGYGAVQEK